MISCANGLGCIHVQSLPLTLSSRSTWIKSLWREFQPAEGTRCHYDLWMVLGCLKEWATMGPRPRIAEEDVRTEARWCVSLCFNMFYFILMFGCLFLFLPSFHGTSWCCHSEGTFMYIFWPLRNCQAPKLIDSLKWPFELVDYVIAFSSSHCHWC